MKDIIDVFRMKEIQPQTRARIIIKLGNIINFQMGANITEPIVFELVSILDPDNEILKSERFKKIIPEKIKSRT